MGGFFTQAQIIKAVAVVAVLMFVVPMIVLQPAVQKLNLGKVGGFALNVLGVMAALWGVRKLGLGGGK